jgi:argonaute-like protein implicated in RNA metabolism and viral defense
VAKSIVGLFNAAQAIVNYYAIRFDMKTPQEEYLNEQGIYPAYPHPLTKKLFVVPTVVDAASLLQSKALENREAVMALHNGKLMPQHLEAIKALTELEEIIILKN